MSYAKPLLVVRSGHSKARLQRNKDDGHFVIDKRMSIHMIPIRKIQDVLGDLVIRLIPDQQDDSFRLAIAGTLRVNEIEVRVHGRWCTGIVLGPDHSQHRLKIIRGDQEVELFLEYNYGLRGYNLEPVTPRLTRPTPNKPPRLGA